jgi:methylthioribose-1-phosphate isomerase
MSKARRPIPMPNLTVSPLTPSVYAVQWIDGACVLLDQTRLPREEVYLRCTSYLQVVDAITTLAVRGAPAIGIAGAFAVALAARESLSLPKADSTEKLKFFEKAVASIMQARPTAVNLAWAVKRVVSEVGSLDEDTVETLVKHAKNIHEEDILANQKMASFGASLLELNSKVITYCNTGDLATGGVGTAFGVLREAHRQKKISVVYPCETRPVMQGSRLTSWECHRNQIPFSVICDNMAGSVMGNEKIAAVFVGADRIAANGDAANKVGTYSLAIVAKYHRVPFYVVAPSSTFDLKTASGRQILIEQRSPREIAGALGVNQPNYPLGDINPAFDVTPADLITAIVCDKGIIAPNAIAEWF